MPNDLFCPKRKANLTELGLNLEKEATILKQFDSTNVVRLWGIVYEPGKRFLIVLFVLETIPFDC